MDIDSNRILSIIIDCQEIIDEHKCEMKDEQYLLLCNYLKEIFMFTKNIRVVINGQTSFIHDMIHIHRPQNDSLSSAECIMFLLNTMRCLIWFYGLCILSLVCSLIIFYSRSKMILS